MKTLIKTNKSLILVSDEEIKEGNNIAHFDLKNNFDLITTCESIMGLKLKHKETIKYGNLYQPIGQYKKVLSQSPIISKEVADEIGWIDFDTWFNEEEKINGILENVDYNVAKFIFQKAQELNQKKYSEYDIVKAIAFGFGVCRKENRAPFNLEQMEFIQSLSQPQQYSCEAIEIDGKWFVTKILK